MKTLKVKSILSSLIIVLAVTVLITSCEQETNIPNNDIIESQEMVTSYNDMLANWNEDGIDSRMLLPCYEDFEAFYQDFAPVNDCNCQIIKTYGDANNSGHISTLDIVILLKLIYDFDVDGDGDFDKDDWSNINCFDTTPSYDYNQDGDINTLDCFEASWLAYGIANTFDPGPDSGLSCEDLECMRAYILGKIKC